MAMDRRDQLDVNLARQFRWRAWKPGDVDALAAESSAREAPPAPAPAPPPAPAAPTAEDYRREEALRAACEALADGVDRAWAQPDAAQSAGATGRLLRRAAAMGLDLGALGARPLQSVRLARLAVRHHSRLPRAARTAFTEALLWLDLGHHESADLLVEVAQTGNARVAGTLQFVLHAGWDPGRARASLVTRLAALLDDPAATWTAKLIALDWLSMVPAREAAEALRSIMFEPHLGARWRALDALLRLDPTPLTGEEVSDLLFDLLDHPLPDGLSEETWRAAEGYAEVLGDAVESLRPEGGADALRELAGRGESMGWRRGADEGWALRVLASAYPEAALDLVDAWLTAPRAHRRREGVEAAARLPPEAARERLLRAAADGAPEVAVRARDLWMSREGTSCLVDTLAGVPVELLDAPASDRMRDRMLVLRHGALDARAAMAEVLLKEAPDREALALLVFLLADDGLWQRPLRPALPTNRGGWARALVEGFGPAGLEALCLLAGPRAGAESWLGAVVEAAREGGVPASLHPALATAAARLLVDAPAVARDAVAVLHLTGAPPEALEPLWRLAVELSTAAQWEASRALVTWPPDPALDDRLGDAMEAALERRDLKRFAALATVGVQRKVPRSVAAAQRALALADQCEDPEDLHAIGTCSYWLFSAGALPPEWVLEGLAMPATRRFSLAAQRAVHAWHADKTSALAVAARAALERALASTEREGAAAADAAGALLHMDALPLRSRRLADAVRRAPPRDRVALLPTLAYHRAPLGALWPAVADLFASSDPVVVDGLCDLLETARWSPREAWPSRARLREVLPKVTDPVLQATMQDVLAGGGEAAYWLDGD